MTALLRAGFKPPAEGAAQNLVSALMNSRFAPQSTRAFSTVHFSVPRQTFSVPSTAVPATMSPTIPSFENVSQPLASDAFFENVVSDSSRPSGSHKHRSTRRDYSSDSEESSDGETTRDMRLYRNPAQEGRRP